MKERMINRGDLFYYDFGNRVGSVQSGERPVLVVQADDYNKNAPTVIVAAVTSVIKKRSRTFLSSANTISIILRQCTLSCVQPYIREVISTLKICILSRL